MTAAGTAPSAEPRPAESAAARHVVVDIHCHVMTPACDDLVRPHQASDVDYFVRYQSESTVAYNRDHLSDIVPKLSDPETRLRDMDRMGVDVQAISVMPAQYYYWTAPPLARRLASMQNDNLARIVSLHPDRFAGLGTVPLQDVTGAVVELDRIARLGFTGIEICTSVDGVDLDDPRFAPFFERVEELDLLIVMHPNGFSDGRRLADYYLINTVGMPMDSTVAIARLIFGGVLERHPDLKICVVHGGGYLPSYPARFDHAYRARADCRENITRPPSEYLRRLYFDTMVFDRGDLRRLIERYGSDHILLGSDYPYDMGEEDPVGLVLGVEGLTDGDRRRVLGANAAELLRLSPADRVRPAAAPSSVEGVAG
jgi:aminocarboxymuconate-semialdehyde decarboxylase